MLEGSNPSGGSSAGTGDRRTHSGLISARAGPAFPCFRTNKNMGMLRGGAIGSSSGFPEGCGFESRPRTHCGERSSRVRTPGCGPGDTSSSLVTCPTEGERERFAACLLNSALRMGISFEYRAFRQRKIKRRTRYERRHCKHSWFGH